MPTQQEEFKEKIKKDKRFREKFKDVKNKKEMISIAKKEGYDLTSLSGEEEASLTEDMLESVAGGKNSIAQKAETDAEITGNSNYVWHEVDITTKQGG